jgi:putative transmembrane protein PGPGW
VILGAILGPVPFIQGWVLGVPGLIILAERYHWAKRALEWAKRKISGEPKPDQTKT